VAEVAAIKEASFDAKLFVGVNVIQLSLWRIRIEDISGWSLAEIDL